MSTFDATNYEGQDRLSHIEKYVGAHDTTLATYPDASTIASVEDIVVSGYLPSPGTSYATYPIFVAQYPCAVKSFWLTPTSAVAQSDTVYWNTRLLRRPGKFSGPPSYIPTGSPATTDGYYKTMILAESNLLDYYVMDETSSTSCADSKTSANSGTYQVAATTGIRGPAGVQNASGAELAYSFDGATSAVVTPSYALPWANGGCYECWVFVNSWTGSATRYTLIGSENTASVPSLEILAGTATDGSNNNGLGITIPGTFLCVTDQTFPGLEPGEWHHIVYNRTSGSAGDNTHQIWVDGTQLTLTSAGTGPATTAFASTSTAHGIGRRAAGSQLVPSGTRMAHVAFYSAPLSSAQIARHYAYGYEFLHKTTRSRDGEAFVANQGWSTEAFTMGSQAQLAAGDTVFLEMEPFGSPVTTGALGYGLRVEPI